MPFIRISSEPSYVKKGTPKEREQRHLRQLADEIFADMLPCPARPTRRNQRRADATDNRQVRAAETAGVEQL